MSVGGKVVQVYQCEDKTWVNTVDGTVPCAVYMEKSDVKPGDVVWWQSGVCYWTRQGVFTERKRKKLGGSGVEHPLGSEHQLENILDRRR